jgi:membrane protease YdiL (CAAX protease family)
VSLWGRGRRGLFVCVWSEGFFFFGLESEDSKTNKIRCTLANKKDQLPSTSKRILNFIYFLIHLDCVSSNFKLCWKFVLVSISRCFVSTQPRQVSQMGYLYFIIWFSMYLWNKVQNSNWFPSWKVVIILVFATIYYILFNNLQHDIVYTSYLQSSLSSHFHDLKKIKIAFFCPTILWQFITTKSKSWALHYDSLDLV